MAGFAFVVVIFLCISLILIAVGLGAYMLDEKKIREAFLLSGITILFVIMLIGVITFNYTKWKDNCRNEIVEVEGGSEK